MRSRSRGAASLVTALSLLFAVPASAEQRPSRVRSLAEMRHESVVIQKWDLSCGAAALATLLTFDYGDPVSEREVVAAMLHRTDPIRVRKRGGFSLLNMQQYVQSRGYEADGYGEMSVTDLSSMLPAIVPVQFHGYDHFVVIRRIENGTVFFADPAYGKRTISMVDFERAWTQRVAFVIAAPRARR